VATTGTLPQSAMMPLPHLNITFHHVREENVLIPYFQLSKNATQRDFSVNSDQDGTK
jgi:hypothetical protein